MPLFLQTIGALTIYAIGFVAIGAICERISR